MENIRALHYKTLEPIEVIIENGTVKRIVPLVTEVVGLPFIAPGLVDLQVNGFKGVDFNCTNTNTTDIINVTGELLRQGVTTYYPTIITNSIENIKTCLKHIAAAYKESATVSSCIGGIHLEGPFISTEEGPAGAHDKKFVRAPDWQLFKELNEVCDGMIKIITLSPEWPGAASFTRKCVREGIIVSIGHTAATGEQIDEVVNTGATMSTHLGNATHQVLPRHPNYIWHQLADERLATCFIGDGFHLPSAVIKVILKVKGEKSILVSDIVSLAGMPPGSYITPIGGSVILTSDAKLHLEGKPTTLAGSAKTLLQAVTNIYRQNLCSLAGAWDLASINPAYYIDGHQKILQEGSVADLVVFTEVNKEIVILCTYKNGKREFLKDN
jgi:N-acetylglucosamine-6-phosphate deacetylase